ncbi:MAG: hypothetical protein KAX49_19835, partial [Halanaerobiales bacterium]|nr:hypothetical protein [Halanaerobiales bacterium]
LSSGQSGVAGTLISDDHYSFSSGAGSGGSILIKCQTADLGTSLVRAEAASGIAGANGYAGGNGGTGRIHVDYLTSITGSTLPGATTTQDNSLLLAASGSLIGYTFS